MLHVNKITEKLHQVTSGLYHMAFGKKLDQKNYTQMELNLIIESCDRKLREEAEKRDLLPNPDGKGGAKIIPFPNRIQ